MTTEKFDLGGVEFESDVQEGDDRSTDLIAGAVAIVKYIDQEGKPYFQTMSTKEVDMAEYYGMAAMLEMRAKAYIHGMMMDD